MHYIPQSHTSQMKIHRYAPHARVQYQYLTEHFFEWDVKITSKITFKKIESNKTVCTLHQLNLILSIYTTSNSKLILNSIIDSIYLVLTFFCLLVCGGVLCQCAEIHWCNKWFKQSFRDPLFDESEWSPETHLRCKFAPGVNSNVSQLITLTPDVQSTCKQDPMLCLTNAIHFTVLNVSSASLSLVSNCECHTKQPLTFNDIQPENSHFPNSGIVWIIGCLIRDYELN